MEKKKEVSPLCRLEDLHERREDLYVVGCEGHGTLVYSGNQPNTDAIRASYARIQGVKFTSVRAGRLAYVLKRNPTWAYGLS